MTEANVVLRLAMEDPLSFEVLDANSDDVMEAVRAHAAEVALGPTISLDTDDCAILLRFDVEATSEAMAYRKIAAVLGAIESHTDLEFTRSASTVETTDGELATAG
jgi:hypothetical protein